MAERYGDELAAALPEVDQVAGFGVGFHDHAPLRPTQRGPQADPREHGAAAGVRPAQPAAPEVARAVGVRQDRRGVRSTVRVLRHPVVPRASSAAATSTRSWTRSTSSTPARSCSWRRTLRRTARTGPASSARAPSSRSCARCPNVPDRVRLLYLYPSDLSDALIDAICDSGVPYFDLSLQHVSKPLLRRMRRWGDGARFLKRIADIREREPDAAFRSNFIVGYPGETEDDHDASAEFRGRGAARLVRVLLLQPGGRHVRRRPRRSGARVVDARTACRAHARCRTRSPRPAETSSSAPRSRCSSIDAGIGRTHREAPEIDGVVLVDGAIPAGTFAKVAIVDALGVDLIAAGADVAAVSDPDEV